MPQGINVGCEVTMAEYPRIHVAHLRRIRVEPTTAYDASAAVRFGWGHLRRDAAYAN